MPIFEARRRDRKPAERPIAAYGAFRHGIAWRSHPITLNIMALLSILNYPDKRLNKVAKPVATVDDRIRKLVADMAETMYAAPGIGLAATQVDVHERVIVIDVSDARDQLIAFINPEIVWQSDERKLNEEGCLSVPGIYDNVERAERVRVRALNEKGETFELDCEGLLAVCIQHEMDHLLGHVFVEYLSPLKQTRIKSKMKKLAHAM
jgi:peptide deformylase